MTNIQLEMVKTLMLEYSREKDKVIFSRLLKQTERLLLYTVYKLLKTRPHLRTIEIQELYHTSILGLAKASFSLKLTEQLRYIPARIIAYVKSEIYSTYPYKPEIMFVEVVDDKYNFYQDDTELVDNLLDLQEAFKNLSFYEKKLLFEKYNNNKSYKKLAEQFCHTPVTIRSTILKILKKLKRNM